MLAVLLKILSVIGIVLLVISAAALLILLLILFMPVVYRAYGAKEPEEKLEARVRLRWLFGFLRVFINYPGEERVLVKLLWFPLYASSQSKEPAGTKAADRKETVKKQTFVPAGDGEEQEALNSEAVSQKPEEGVTKSNFFGIFDKIKYTIQTVCDKIKHIRDDISFYQKLLQDENTQIMFSHVCKRVAKVLRHIRPSKLKANITFGAESPDTTGYVYGIYCMFSPRLGKDVCVIPDFEQSILQGTVSLAGHVTVFKLVVCALAIYFDKHLRLFIRRVKKHSAKRR